jgi:hypothetical protein
MFNKRATDTFPVLNPRPVDLERLAQIGILIGTLGLMLTLIGLFPSITGVEPKQGVGVLQILLILIGLSLVIIGALIFVKSIFYPFKKLNLAQEIAVRLSLTGLLVTAAGGLADVLGFGSHPPNGEENLPLLGNWQAVTMIMGFLVASFGVMIFALMGPPPEANEFDIE